MTTKKTRTAPLWLASLVAATALLAALTATAALAPATDDKSVAPPADPPPGQLLIAAATIQDPRFYHAVILVVRHDRSGAFGIVVNKPIDEEKIADLLADAKGGGGDGGDTDPSGKNGAGKAAPDGPLQGTIRVFLGGPVQPQFGFLIHSADYRRDETVSVTEAISMTATKEALRDIGLRNGPNKYLFALGYSGWGPGQLENEIARRDWFTEPAESDLVFDIERDEVWEKALARRTHEL